jgi:hypothetical protein
MPSELKKETMKNLDGSETEYEYIEPSQEVLEPLCRELFEHHWREITFGPCVAGAVFEIRLKEKRPKVTMSDGYLTVDPGPWHFHLCLGDNKGAANPELARRRRVGRAAFFHDIREGKGCVPGSWGLRLWNGNGEQMITIFFPNPYLDTEQRQQEPDWSKLELWNQLRQKCGASS